MKQIFIFFLVTFFSNYAFSQNKFSKHELSINAFRNPSIGAEYRYRHISVHAGYYPTNFESGITTEFIRTGLTYWFLPVGKKPNPSSFYGSLSFARGTSRDFKNQNAGIAEVGFRWMIYKGINLRIGIAALAAKGKSVKINPTPGLSYSFNF
ncbi:MAG TPA: hypothetical protein VK616_08620 [Flavitalea sp.]|nr:hypothetical protein [Flavitalea sp.]HTF29766.1 hypothetical protein [Flavitalea sp.]